MSVEIAKSKKGMLQFHFGSMGEIIWTEFFINNENKTFVVFPKPHSAIFFDTEVKIQNNRDDFKVYHNGERLNEHNWNR